MASNFGVKWGEGNKRWKSGTLEHATQSGRDTICLLLNYCNTEHIKSTIAFTVIEYPLQTLQSEAATNCSSLPFISTSYIIFHLKIGISNSLISSTF